MAREILKQDVFVRSRVAYVRDKSEGEKILRKVRMDLNAPKQAPGPTPTVLTKALFVLPHEAPPNEMFLALAMKAARGVRGLLDAHEDISRIEK